MKINKRTNKKPSYLYIVVVAIVTIAGLAALYFTSTWPFQRTGQSSNQLSEEQKGTSEKIKNDVISQNENGKSNTGSDPTPAPIESPDGGKASVNSYSASVSQDTNGVYIRSIIQTVTSSGTCTLAMTGPNGKTYTATAEVQAQPSYTTCKGFDVPRSSLSSGTWSIKVSFENETLTSSYTTTLEVQ